MTRPDTTPSKRSLNEWCNAIALATVSPGGGSAAAIAAGLAAAVVGMVAGLTGRREKYAAVHDQAHHVRQRASNLSERFLALAARDEQVLEAFSRALALPQGTDAEQALRTEAKRAALRDAAVVQFDLLVGAVEVAELAASMAESGLASAVGDSATAAFLATGAARSAYWAARSDLSGWESDAEMNSRPVRMRELLQRAGAVERRVEKLLSEKLP